MSFNTSYLINQQQNMLLSNAFFKVEQTGYHYAGETAGKRNQKIADTSKIRKLSLEIIVDKAPAGRIFLCYYSELGETLNFPFEPLTGGVQEDIRVLRCIELTQSKNNTKETFKFSAEEYDFLNSLSVGVSIFFESPQIGCEVDVRIWGSI